MTRLRTLLLVLLLPLLMVPGGVSICLCGILGGQHAMERCATCRVTCCGHSSSDDARVKVEGARERDCFLHVPATDPISGSMTKHAAIDHDVSEFLASTADAILPFFAAPSILDAGTRARARSASPRVSSSPLFARALPLRL